MRNAVLFVATLSLFATAACTQEDEQSDVAQEVAGTPDELALLRFLNDATTTVSVLDDQVPLDSRAAKNIVAHRAGPDGLIATLDDNLFDSAAEVDAVPYVGPSAMDAMLDFALAGGWVHDDEVFGTFDGVAFTMAEARAAVDLVNTDSADTLKNTLKLDSRAVNSIVAARPILTMAQLEGLYYVGPSAMTKIHSAVIPAPTCTDDAALISQLTTSINGMWLTSESDYPLALVSYPGQGPASGSASTFLALIGQPAGTHVVVNTIDWLFTRLGYSNDQAQVDALRAFVTANLRNVVVYEVGLIQVHDYVVGVTPCGGVLGFTAVSIET
jgi:hypothetical protein